MISLTPAAHIGRSFRKDRGGTGEDSVVRGAVSVFCLEDQRDGEVASNKLRTVRLREKEA